ncbi:MAG: HAMP domain-containing histidine kinase [Lachnospiraceae bacterium]|nr:HAMP domain-containing histidine kinase [Lachnospiraceae bacterium]
MRGSKKKEKGILQGLKSRKRKKFSTLFLYRWLVVMIITALLYAEGLAIFVTYQKSESKQKFSFAKNHQLQYYNSLSLEYTEQELLNWACFWLAYHAEGYNTFSYMCDAQSMEIIAGCEEKMFLVNLGKPESNERNRVYICKTSDIEAFESYRQKLLSYGRPLRRLYETIQLKEEYIYSDGINFWPGNLKVETTAIDLGEYMLGVNRDEKELFPFELKSKYNIPDGYVKTDISNNGVILLGYSSTSPYMKVNNSNEDGYTLLKSLYEGIRADSEEWVSGQHLVWQERENFFVIQLASKIEMKLPGGREVILLQVSILDVWKNYGSVLLGIGLLAIMLGTLVAFGLAKISYMRLKAGYDLEDYRKTLTNTMAHDLKSPLMSISGYAENLRDNLNTEKQGYYSQAILNNVQYMNGIIESVLYMSKMEEGKLSLKKESIHAKELLEKLVADRHESLQERELKVEIEGDVLLEADATLLEQLLCNLLDNAIKYALRDTTICVMMKDKEISIQNACEEDLQGVADTLCQPFVVGDTSRSNQKGSGLGLAIAKNICELHGLGFELICKEKSFEAKIKG